MLVGPVGARGAGTDHSTGLESRFLGEVANMAKDLPLPKPNDVVAKIYSCYTDRVSNAPHGRPFNGCYIVNSEYQIRSRDEYLSLYKKVLGEIRVWCF